MPTIHAYGVSTNYGRNAMPISEIIEDLKAIISYFMEENNGCYPLSLEEAIKILRLYEAEETQLNRPCN